MLVADELIKSIEAGTMKPLAGGIVVKRDSKSETLGSLGLIINPTQVSHVEPDWTTVLCVPDKVFNTFGGELVDCPLKPGDRVFIKPSDGDKQFDRHKEYQFCRFLDIIAIETEDGIMPFLDRVMVKMKSGEQKTAGGLFLPDSAMSSLTMGANDSGEGQVVAVGYYVREDIQIGDLVRYLPFKSPRLKDENDNIFMFVKIEDCYGIDPEVRESNWNYYVDANED